MWKDFICLLCFKFCLSNYMQRKWILSLSNIPVRLIESNRSDCAPVNCYPKKNRLHCIQMSFWLDDEHSGSVSKFHIIYRLRFSICFPFNKRNGAVIISARKPLCWFYFGSNIIYNQIPSNSLKLYNLHSFPPLLPLISIDKEETRTIAHVFRQMFCFYFV